MALSDNGKVVKDFLNEVPIEASMPAAPVPSRPAHNSEAKLNWPTQNDALARSNWGSKAEHFEVKCPNVGTMSTYDDFPSRYNQLPNLSCPSSGTKPNWSGCNDSSPRVMVQSGLISYPDSSTKSKWPNSCDDYPPRCIVRPKCVAHPNLDSTSNWPIRNDSPPRVMEYYDSDIDSNAKSNWPKAGDNSLLNSMMYPQMNRPNSGTRKPNWPSNPNYSPPKSMVHSRLGCSKSHNMCNWVAQYEPPKYVEKGKDQRNSSPLHKKLEKVNIHDSRGSSSPIPNKMNADNAKSGSNVMKLKSYNGTSLDVLEDYSNQPSRPPVKTGNINYSSNKENPLQVREFDQRPNWPNSKKGQDGKEEHEKPKSSDGGQIKKGNEEKIQGLENPKSVTFRSTTTPISSIQEVPAENFWGSDSTTPQWSKSTLIDSMEAKKQYGALSSEVVWFSKKSSEVVNPLSSESMGAWRAAYLTQAERNGIHVNSYSFLRWVVSCYGL